MPAPFRIVVIDDAATARAAVGAAVRAEPALEHVGEASGGVEALHLIRSARPDVALVDVLMPDLTGSEVAATLRTEGLPTSFVLMSQLDGTELALHAARAGAASFADKARGPAFVVEVALAMARRWDGLR